MNGNIKLVDYKTLSVQKKLFKDINLKDSFFDSLRKDYESFDSWFLSKSNEKAYVLFGEFGICAFLFLKVENEEESYKDINPSFPPLRRLKVGTFKVSATGQRLGERFLKIIFDNALCNNVEEIYVTIFDRSDEQKHLISLLEDWGFKEYGLKSSGEKVYTRKIIQPMNCSDPRKSYPIVDLKSNAYITPIYPEYHTNLFPDSILNTESPLDFVESQAHRNSIEKIFISRSLDRNLQKGDIVFFYRTAEEGKPAFYNAVVTTVAVVTDVFDGIKSESDFIKLCKNRTVLTESELKKWWNGKQIKPFIVKFLQIASFPHRVTRGQLIDAKFPSIKNGPEEYGPRGFVKITTNEVNKLLEMSRLDRRIFI